MQISLEWINELVDVETIKLDELIDKLTLGGFEVEEVIDVDVNGQNKIALDISATANRSDSLSIQGLGLEISALLNKPIKSNIYSTTISDWKEKIIAETKFNNFESDCIQFLAVSIENLTKLESPNWMQQKLIASGVTPSNDIIDFRNYVLLETGYPIELYDFDKIKANLQQSEIELKLERAQVDQTFLASNQISYCLNDSIFIVKANDIPISIAGIIENEQFKCSHETKTLLLEASIFTASNIRQQARRLGLRTDRSARYEKALKPTYLVEAVYRFIELLKISNPNIACKIELSRQSVKSNQQEVELNYTTITEILGPTIESTTNVLKYITPAQINEYLVRLQFSFIYDNQLNQWKVEIPDSRTDDLTQEIDIIEEVGRLHGFNNFLTTLPNLSNVGLEDLSYKVRKKLSTCLLNLGLNEFIHYSLVEEENFIKNEVKLINPLLIDCSNLRRSLLPSLLTTIQQNVKQGNSVLEGFEYGHIFLNQPDKKFKEIEYIAGSLGGQAIKSNWSESPRPITWFEAKGKLEQVFNQLNLSIKWEANNSDLMQNILHPYRSANLYLSNDLLLGYFGQIHPLSAKKLGLPNELYLFELNFELIKQSLNDSNLTIYKNYSVFPKVSKDISFIISRDISFEELKTELYLNGTKFLSEIYLLDEYKDETMPENKTSLCIQLIFQSQTETLQNKQIDTVVLNLQNILRNKFEATLRV